MRGYGEVPEAVIPAVVAYQDPSEHSSDLARDTFVDRDSSFGNRG